jgi:hypothetical protein
VSAEPSDVLVVVRVAAIVDVKADEFDGPVGRELSDHGEGVHQQSGHNEDAVIIAAIEQTRQAIEADSKPLNDLQQLERLKVVGRWLPVVAPLPRELPVEVPEELCGGSNLATPARHDAGVSAASIRPASRARVGSTKSVGASRRSVTTEASNSSERSAGDMCSSSTAVRTRCMS